MLPQTQLGSTDLFVSRLGLGTVKLGRNQHVKYPKPFELPSDADAQKLLHCARDLGINLLDTAASYSLSEERLGYLLRGERKAWVISTKAGEEFSYNPASAEACSHFDFSPDALRCSIERSLRRLRTDYLDIALIHSDGNDSEIIHRHQVLHTLSELKRAGWIRAFGVSTKTIEGGLICAREADLVMTTFDPDNADDQNLMLSCEANNTGVLLKKIFDSGHLITNSSNNSIIDARMRVIFAQKAVNSAIIGTLNCQHLRTNVECALTALADQVTT